MTTITAFIPYLTKGDFSPTELKAFGEIKLSQTQISELMLSEIEEDEVEK